MEKLKKLVVDLIICMAFGFFGGWLFLWFCGNELACDTKAPHANMVASPEVTQEPMKVLYVAKSDKTKIKKNDRRAGK